MAEIDEIRERKLKELENKILRDGSGSAKPVEVKDKDFDKFIKENPAAVVDFWASWCMPCVMLAPTVDAVAKKLAGKVAFGKLNVDENRTTPQKYEVMAIPTLIFFKNGKMVDQVVGSVSQEILEEKIKKHFG